MLEDPLLPRIIVLIVLIVLNALFAAAEKSLNCLPEGKVRKQAEEGDPKSEKLVKLMDREDDYLSAVQIGITFVSLLLAAFAADAFAARTVAWLDTLEFLSALPAGALQVIALLFVVLVLGCAVLLLGEMVPRKIAAVRPEGVARATCGAAVALAVVFRPLNWLISLLANGVLRLFRIDPRDTAEDVSEDEILMMVDMGEEKGTIETAEKEMIENIFEFNNNTAEDVMVHRTDMVMIWQDESREEILRTIESSGLSRFPVYNEDADDIVGILSTRDYLFNTHRSQPKTFKELLRPAYFVPESVRTDVLFRDMQSKKVHMAIVVDEYGGTSGLVTMEDLLEEIVGNIYDEFDPQDEQDVIRLEDNLWRVAGSVELEQLAEELDVELPEDEEYDTLGGLVFSQLSVIPEDGSTLEVDVCGLHVKVEEIAERRVEWALVSRLPRPENED